MLDKVKLALRITHTLLDSTIEDSIETARAELIRSGVSVEKANDDDDNLIVQAIITYCMSIHANVSDLALERYNQSWLYQLDNLRKSAEYRA